MSVNQNVPTCVASRHQQWLPPEPELREQQSVLVGRRLQLPRLAHVDRCSGPRAGAPIECRYTLSKSKNNVGEFFFSSPIDPFDLSKDWGRSDDDQRHRLVLSGAINSPMEPATTCGSASATGFS